MFLNQLNDAEKNMFVSLSVNAAEINEDFDDEERIMIQEYCKEMGIFFFDSKNIKPMTEVCAFFSEADIDIKRIVYLELSGLLYADGEYDETERVFATDFAEKIGITKEDEKNINDVFEKYMQITKEMFNVINL